MFIVITLNVSKIFHEHDVGKLMKILNQKRLYSIIRNEKINKPEQGGFYMGQGVAGPHI